MRLNLTKNAARALAMILRLSGRLATRKAEALEYAINAGMGKPDAVRLVERLARKEAV